MRAALCAQCLLHIVEEPHSCVHSTWLRLHSECVHMVQQPLLWQRHCKHAFAWSDERTTLHLLHIAFACALSYLYRTLSRWHIAEHMQL